MNNSTLAASYLTKARVRLKVLSAYLEEEAYSDVIREAQEAVELALKGMLREIGVEPPKQHDVGRLLLEYSDKFPMEVSPQLPRLAEISKWLRKEQEFSFYGDVDFIPALEYTLQDAKRAILDTAVVVDVAGMVIK